MLEKKVQQTLIEVNVASEALKAAEEVRLLLASLQWSFHTLCSPRCTIYAVCVFADAQQGVFISKC